MFEEILDSEEFLRDLRAGEDEAFKKLRRFAYRILEPRYRRLGLSHLADDLVSETIGKISRTIGSDYDPAKGSLVSWVITVGWRVGLDEWRRQRRQREIQLEELDIDQCIYFHVAEEISGWLEVKQWVMRALGSLEDIDRAILCQRLFQGLPFDIIAKNIGTTARNARMRLSRARDRLWREMERLAPGDLQARIGRSRRRNPRGTLSASHHARKQKTRIR